MSLRTLFATTAILSAALAGVSASPSPNTPDTGIEGKTCTITWEADTTGQWTNTAIELMTGDNWQMVHLTTVTTIDATKQTSYSWTCPAVNPNAAIYFYQFSAAGQNLTWTTRFALAGADGSTVPASETTQPDGQKIAWGTGALADPSTAVAPPAWLASGSGAASGSITATGVVPVGPATNSVPAASTGSTASASSSANSVASSMTAGSTSTPVVGSSTPLASAPSSSGPARIPSSSTPTRSSTSATGSSTAASSNTSGASSAASLHLSALALAAAAGVLALAF